MNIPPRRTLRIAALTMAMAATGIAVAIGFGSGWLTTNTSSVRPVGRLRPADLTADISTSPYPDHIAKPAELIPISIPTSTAPRPATSDHGRDHEEEDEDD